VFKPVDASSYDQAFRLQSDLAFIPFVRLPVDGIDAITLLYSSIRRGLLEFYAERTSFQITGQANPFRRSKGHYGLS
jgi:hypothetical protein